MHERVTRLINLVCDLCMSLSLSQSLLFTIIVIWVIIKSVLTVLQLAQWVGSANSLSLSLLAGEQFFVSGHETGLAVILNSVSFLFFNSRFQATISDYHGY